MSWPSPRLELAGSPVSPRSQASSPSSASRITRTPRAAFLLIANSNYYGANPVLPNVQKDCEAMLESFKGMKYKVKVHEGLTAEAIRQTVQEFQNYVKFKMEEDGLDLVGMHYSGHGSARVFFCVAWKCSDNSVVHEEG